LLIYFTQVNVFLPKTKEEKLRITWSQIDIVSSIPEDSEMKVIIDQFTSLMQSKIKKQIAFTSEAFNALSSVVRTTESNLGNFVCDVIKSETGAEVVLLNGGTIRSDDVYGPGPLTVENLLSIFPFEDIIVVARVTGKQIRAALENSVSKLPKTEGRFAQISGIRFTFDPSAEPLNRVREVFYGSTKENQVPLDESRKYLLATKTYLLQGKDGYDMFGDEKDIDYVVDCENGRMLSSMLRSNLSQRYFLNILTTGDDIHRAAVSAKKWLGKLRSSGASPSLARSLNDSCDSDDGNLSLYLPRLSPVCDGRISTVVKS
jgi:2',3'-cyclic-nucleotide 2'-phosphodiesterase (5'-nucleotidase family)